MSLSFKPVRKVMLCAATAASLAALAPLTVAHAQPDYSYRTGSDDQITVYGAHRQGRSWSTGAPIEWTRESRVVYFGDLDLGTRYGQHMLRVRVSNAARQACDQLEFMNPIATDDSPPCFRTAYRDAMGRTPVGYYRTDYRPDYRTDWDGGY